MATQILDDKFSIGKLFSIAGHFILIPATLLILYLLINTVSNDVGEYAIIWSLLNEENFFAAFSVLRYEFGSLLVLWILANLFSPLTMFFLTGAIAITIKYYLFNKYLNYSFIAFIFYVLAFVPVLDANTLRAALAVCFIFYAIFLEPKSKYSYLFLTIVACLFHYSGVIILLFYFVRHPILPLVGIVCLGFILDSIISSSAYLTFAMIWLSSAEGAVSLTNPFFIMQVCISIVCAFNWRKLSEGQKRGALLNMLGVVAYIAFINNPIVAHRLRELSQIGIFAILFLGVRRLTVVKFVTSICFGFIIATTVYLVSAELMLINGIRF